MLSARMLASHSSRHSCTQLRKNNHILITSLQRKQIICATGSSSRLVPCAAVRCPPAASWWTHAVPATTMPWRRMRRPPCRVPVTTHTTAITITITTTGGAHTASAARDVGLIVELPQRHFHRHWCLARRRRERGCFSRSNQPPPRASSAAASAASGRREGEERSRGGVQLACQSLSRGGERSLSLSAATTAAASRRHTVRVRAPPPPTCGRRS